MWQSTHAFTCGYTRCCIERKLPDMRARRFKLDEIRKPNTQILASELVTVTVCLLAYQLLDTLGENKDTFMWVLWPTSAPFCP